MAISIFCLYKKDSSTPPHEDHIAENGKMKYVINKAKRQKLSKEEMLPQISRVFYEQLYFASHAFHFSF